MATYELPSAFDAYFRFLPPARSQPRPSLHERSKAIKTEQVHSRLQHFPSDRLHVLRGVVD